MGGCIQTHIAHKLVKPDFGTPLCQPLHLHHRPLILRWPTFVRVVTCVI